MKRLTYPVVLVFFALLAAATFTTFTAKALASYSGSDKGAPVAHQQVAEGLTASR